MRIIYLGTPQFAVAPLKALIASHHEIIAVICQPDRERDKKGNIIFPAVKACAIENGIQVLQLENIKENAGLLREIAPDIMVTAAYGQILSKDILAIPKHGIINIHASLLPKYRGSSPVQHAIINGEKETGVTIMQTDIGLDTGDIISVAKTVIRENETTEELLERLSHLGAELLIKTLPDIENGKIVKTPQDEVEATKCTMIKKTDGLIDWSKSAKQIKDFIHGMNPWPLAHSYLSGKRINIYRAEMYQGMIPLKLFFAGEVCTVGGNFIVACGEGGYIKLTEVQAEGKKKIDGSEMIRGLRLSAGERFSNER